MEDRNQKVIVNRQSAERIDRAVRMIEGTPLPALSSKVRYAPQSIPLRWGKVTVISGTTVTVRTVTAPVDSETQDYISDDEDQVVTLRLINPDPLTAGLVVVVGVAVDDIVAYLPYSTTQGMMLNPVVLPVGQVFAVDLVSDGGADGDTSTAASWTYTVTSIGGDELLTTATPECPRPLGMMAAAVKGLAYYDMTGAVRLSIAYETPDTETCGAE